MGFYDNQRPIHLSLTVGATSQLLLEQNPRRSYVCISNDSANVLYLQLGVPAAANQGIRVNGSGGSYEITAENLYRGRIYGICTGAGSAINITEQSV